MTYNVEALMELSEVIAKEARLGKHDQRVWGRLSTKIADIFHWQSQDWGLSCPSSACAAGWTVTQAGAKMLFDPADVDKVSFRCLTKDGDVVEIERHAAAILGLNKVEQDWLFAADLSTEDVLAMISEIVVAAKHGRTWSQQRVMSRV